MEELLEFPVHIVAQSTHHRRWCIGEVAPIQDALGRGTLAPQKTQQPMDLLRKWEPGHVEEEALTQDLLEGIALVAWRPEELAKDADAIDHRGQGAAAVRHDDGDVAVLDKGVVEQEAGHGSGLVEGELNHGPGNGMEGLDGDHAIAASVVQHVAGRGVYEDGSPTPV